jgi:DNA repair and recombination protein RAD54B
LQYLRQKKAQLAALGQWTHINCLRPSAALERIQDAVLQQLVHVPDGARKDDWGIETPSRVSSLLEAVDLENVLQATGPPLAVGDLPGGSVSFLFERTSKTGLDGSETGSMIDEEL